MSGIALVLFGHFLQLLLNVKQVAAGLSTVQLLLSGHVGNGQGRVYISNLS